MRDAMSSPDPWSSGWPPRNAGASTTTTSSLRIRACTSPCLSEALLDKATADDAVIQALLDKGSPVLRRYIHLYELR